MNIQFFEPPNALHSIIKGYWYADSTSLKQASYRIFSDGYPGMILQHAQGQPGLFRGDVALPLCFLYGQKTKGFCLNECHNGTLFFGIQFQPYALKHIWGINAAELTDLCIDARELLDDIQLDQLLDFTKAEQFLFYFNAYFGRLISSPTASLPYIVPLTREFESYLGCTSKQLAQEFHLSTRTFQREFKAYIGLSFEAYKQLIKFHVAVRQLQQIEDSKLVELAYDLAYADQAHFGRVFKLYSGFTPKAFVQKQWGYNEVDIIRTQRLRIVAV